MTVKLKPLIFSYFHIYRHQTETPCDTVIPKKLILVILLGFEVDTLGKFLHKLTFINMIFVS